MVRFRTDGSRFQRSRLLLRLAFGVMAIVLFMAMRQPSQQDSIEAGAKGTAATAADAEGGGGSASAPAPKRSEKRGAVRGAKVIGKYRVALEGGLEEERDLLDEPIPKDCYAEPHADYKGPDGALTWGLTYKLPSAAQCCQACKDFKSTADGKFCNIWVFCPDPSGQCWSPDIWNHTSGECWLKFQRNWDNSIDRSATNLEVNRRGAFPKEFREVHKTAPKKVQWMSGVIPKKKSA